MIKFMARMYFKFPLLTLLQPQMLSNYLLPQIFRNFNIISFFSSKPNCKGPFQLSWEHCWFKCTQFPFLKKLLLNLVTETIYLGGSIRLTIGRERDLSISKILSTICLQNPHEWKIVIGPCHNQWYNVWKSKNWC